MDIEQEYNRFVNEQMEKFPTLTDFDISNLRLGFMRGVVAQLEKGIEALEAKQEAVND